MFAVHPLIVRTTAVFMTVLMIAATAQAQLPPPSKEVVAPRGELPLPLPTEKISRPYHVEEALKPLREYHESDYERALFIAAHRFARCGDALELQAMLKKHPDWLEMKMQDFIKMTRKPSSTDEDYTLLITAIRYNQLKVVNLLMGLKADVQEYHIRLAVSVGNVDLLKLIWKKGTDPNVCWSDHWTDEGSMFHLAVANGHLEVVEFLLEKGADLNKPTPGLPLREMPFAIGENAPILSNRPRPMLDAIPSYTPLELAIKNKHVEVVKFLKSKGAKEIVK